MIRMKDMSMTATLHTDGGARGNPGPAGIGFVLRIKNKEAIFHGEYIGETTNNQAEYQALIAGLKRAKQEGVSAVACFLDSELVVKQLQGVYRIKHPDLKPVVAQAQVLIHSFDSITFTAVPRERNKEADLLVNQTLDAHG